MLKVALVCLNSKFIHTSLGIWYIKEYCKDCNAKFFMFDTFVNRNTEDIVADILECKPDIVGFSVYIFNVEKTVEVIKQIKEAGIKVVLGGPEATYNKDIWKYADQIVLGEGELAWKNILQGDKTKIITGIPVVKPVFPYTEEYFENAENRIVYFEASRGCPFSCSYCMSCNTNLRQFDFDEVTNQLLKFKNRDIKLIKFVDRTFNANKKYATRLIDWIVENFSDDGIRFHFEAAPELFDEPLFSAIENARKGLLQFEIGFQSFNEKSLITVNRKMNMEKSADNVKRLVDFGNCHIHTDLIVGLPYEDFDSFKKSFNSLYELNAQQLQVGFLKILKGSELEKNLPKGYRVNENAPYEIIESPWIDENGIKQLKSFEVAVNSVFNSHRFESIINFGLKYNNPFDFFNGLSDYIEDFIPLFDVYSGVKKYMLNCGYDEIIVNELLKFDYLKSNKSKGLPPAVKKDYNADFKSRVNFLKKDYSGYRFFRFKINPLNLEKTPCIIAFATESNDTITGHFDYKIFSI